MCSRSSQEYVSSYQLLILKNRVDSAPTDLPTFYQKKTSNSTEERLFSVLKLNILKLLKREHIRGLI